jgi:hypothetical protein
MINSLAVAKLTILTAGGNPIVEGDEYEILAIFIHKGESFFLYQKGAIRDEAPANWFQLISSCLEV